MLCTFLLILSFYFNVSPSVYLNAFVLLKTVVDLLGINTRLGLCGINTRLGLLGINTRPICFQLVFVKFGNL